MRDFGPDEADGIRDIDDRFERVLADGGFLPLDTPIVERTELFVRKSGGEIAGNLYTFTDPGGESVSLRPEFTPSVIRWFVENVDRPSRAYRYRYSGPVFRYIGSDGAGCSEFRQMGGEIIGLSEPDGDIEILETVIRCVESVGLSGYSIRIGHIGIIRDLVESFGLSATLQMFVAVNLREIISNPSYADTMLRKARAAGLIFDGSREETASLNVTDNAGVLLDTLGASLPASMGRRSPEQIVARLIRRREQASSESEFRIALQSVARLVEKTGYVSETTGHVERVLADSGASSESATQLGKTLSKLRRAGVEESAMLLDMSFVRGAAYYTGIVFDLLIGSGRSAVSIGGGGRYDDLVRAFGGPDVPACGFALDVDNTALALSSDTGSDLESGSR